MGGGWVGGVTCRGCSVGRGIGFVCARYPGPNYEDLQAVVYKAREFGLRVSVVERYLPHHKVRWCAYATAHTHTHPPTHPHTHAHTHLPNHPPIHPPTQPSTHPLSHPPVHPPTEPPTMLQSRRCWGEEKGCFCPPQPFVSACLFECVPDRA
jgi:hypothetical protein